jgi:hypothetical protein
VPALVRWYRTGDNVDAKLPTLSTYRGSSRSPLDLLALLAARELLARAA